MVGEFMALGGALSLAALFALAAVWMMQPQPAAPPAPPLPPPAAKKTPPPPAPIGDRVQGYLSRLRNSHDYLNRNVGRTAYYPGAPSYMAAPYTAPGLPFDADPVTRPIFDDIMDIVRRHDQEVLDYYDKCRRMIEG